MRHLVFARAGVDQKEDVQELGLGLNQAIMVELFKESPIRNR